ncbi:MAG: tripartite tricarboxylate transporter permease, partial [Bacillati bacterium ANGP1]
RGPRGMIRGFLTGCLGLLLAAVGQDPQVGVQRYTLQQLYLWNGLDLVPVLVGFFAIPEIIDLAVRGTAIAADAPLGRLSQVRDGVIDAFRHIWLVIRCSLIGTYIGIIPGVGGGVAQWIAYAHAVQSAKTPAERDGFGKGDVRGVLGPGAAVNSKEGGALIPTIAFGVPGSSAMAILLGGFFVVGLVPGPDMLTKHLDVTMSMVWTIVVANIITVVASFVFLNRLARLTNIRGALLIPFLALLTFLGAYTSNNSLNDIIVALVFGGLGYLMVRYRWPRAPLVLGLVLGEVAERYLWISVARYGSAWLARPIVVLLILLVIGVIGSSLRQQGTLPKRQGAVGAT